MINIQKASVKDIDLVVALGKQTFYETYASWNTSEDMDLYVADNFSIEKLKDEFKEEGTVFLLARDGDKEVGYAKICQGKKPSGLRAVRPLHIARIYCIQEYQGKGVGKLFMQFCLDYARRKNCDVAWLGVWGQNAKAIAFYEKWGFEKFGEHVFTLGKDKQTDYFMKKKL